MVHSGKLLYEIEVDGVLTKREMKPGRRDPRHARRPCTG